MPSTPRQPLVQKKCAYFDKKSIEESTGRKKKKYKLACNKVLNTYHFYVLTSNEEACSNWFKFRISREDWERITPNHLRGPASFTDLKKVDVIDEDDLLQKISDTQNKFSLSGVLKQEKYDEFVDFCRTNAHLHHLRAPLRKTIISALVIKSEEEDVSEILAILGLNTP